METEPAIKFTFSPEIDKLAPALVKFQKAVRPALKASKAKVEKEGRLLYTYAYANFADVQEATREPLADAELAVIQPPVGSSLDGITIVTIVLHSSGQWMRGDLTAKPLDQKPQTIGSLITYNRRYSYSGCLGIVTDEDDDGAAASGVRKMDDNAKPPGANWGKPRDKTKPANDPDSGEVLDAGQLAELAEAFDSKWGRGARTAAPSWLKAQYGTDNPANLTKVQATEALQKLLAS